MEKNTYSKIDAELMRDAQYRKELSISFFNATNSAIALVTSSVTKATPMEKKMQLIDQVREQFLDKYKQYRVDILDSITKPAVDPSIQEGLDRAKAIYENLPRNSTGNGGVAH